MEKNRRNRASALVVAVGLLAVLSAMAFTFVTVMRVEMDASIATQQMTQTAMLDQWAVQQVVDRLIRTPNEGAMYTPVDWAGEEWYTRPLIEASPALPLGGVMSFGAELPGKGTYTIDARVMDCSSQISLADISDMDIVERKVRMLASLPFGLEYAWKGDDLNYYGPDPRPGTDGTDRVMRLGDVLTDADLRGFLKRVVEGREELPTKEGLLNFFMKNSKLKNEVREKSEEKVAEYFLGKRDMAGNILTVGVKDFISLYSWIDTRAQTAAENGELAPQPRAPINVNTASSWTLIAVFNGITSEEATITLKDAEELADYVLAYRTPGSCLPDDLLELQDDLVEWITDFTGKAGVPDAHVADPKTEPQLKAQLSRLAHLLINPSYEDLKKQMSKLGGSSELPEADYYHRLPRPFATWAQFDAFLKLIVCKGNWGGSVEAGRTKARAVMANCNPNTNYSGQPIRNGCAVWNCGKDRIKVGTTELCFTSYGLFEIEMVVGKTRQVHGGPGSGGVSEDNFSGDGSRVFSASGIETSKLRTINGSAYCPDRLCLYNKKNELVIMRAVLDVDTGTDDIVLDRGVESLNLAGVSYWAIQRIESMKKWTAIVKFADVARIDHEADFLLASGTGASFYPEPERKKKGSPAAGGSDDRLVRDGSIAMETVAEEDDDWDFHDPFSRATTVGLTENSGSIYEGGLIFSNGFWLKGDVPPLKYGFNTKGKTRGLFPAKRKNKDLEFTVCMWLCLNRDDAEGTIINCPEKGGGSPIMLEIRDGNLELRLKGVVEDEAGQPDSMTISLTGGKGIPVGDWRAGEWFWIGFAYEESSTQGSEGKLFAAKAGDDGKLKLESVKTEQLPDQRAMALYGTAPPAYAKFGCIDAVVDDVTAYWKYTRDVGSIMPETRFGQSTYSSPDVKPGTRQDIEIEYGTVSWTEYLTSKALPAGKHGADDDPKAGDHFSDGHVSVYRSSKLGSTAGKAESSTYNPLLQIPIWFSHEDLVSGWGKAARIGKCGEGQRLGEDTGSSASYWTGYTGDESDTENLNASGHLDDELTVKVRFWGPGDDPEKGDETFSGAESPYVDDATISYFLPLDVKYWKLSTDPTE